MANHDPECPFNDTDDPEDCICGALEDDLEDDPVEIETDDE